MNVYPDGQAPSLLLLEKVPAGGCGGDTLRNFRSEIDVSASNSTFRFCVLTHSGTCYRCPLHIRRLRAAPSPAGEGFFWLSSGGGDTFDQLLSFATFRAAGSRPYGILLEFVHRIVTRAIVLIKVNSSFTIMRRWCILNLGIFTEKGG